MDGKTSSGRWKARSGGCKTDCVDLYWMHAWDGLTPVEEVLSTLDALVRAGKVRAIGFSDMPAWYLARAQTLAEFRGWEPLCALQLEYSLVERNIEREHVPAALALGVGSARGAPWRAACSPASTVVTARSRDRDGWGPSSSPESWLPEALHRTELADCRCAGGGGERVGRSPAQVALNWVARRPAVASTIIGATKPSQLDDNLAALAFELPEPLAAPAGRGDAARDRAPVPLLRTRDAADDDRRDAGLGPLTQSFASTASIRARQVRSLAAPR